MDTIAIKEEVKKMLKDDFNYNRFTNEQIDAAIYSALNRCDYKGTIRKIAKEAIHFLFA